MRPAAPCGAASDLRAGRRHRRLRLLADRPQRARRHRAAAVAVVGARDGRSGRRARRARARRRRSPTRKPAAGDAPSSLECRRRGIPPAGLQHGFIYRHWLNYRHEPDEMHRGCRHRRRSRLPASGTHAALRRVRGATTSRLTGRFPADALRVTGSPRLDELARVASARCRRPTSTRARSRHGAADARRARRAWRRSGRKRATCCRRSSTRPRHVPDVQLAIKPHPAETPEAYAAAAARRPRVRVLRAVGAAAAAAGREPARSSP